MPPEMYDDAQIRSRTKLRVISDANRIHLPGMVGGFVGGLVDRELAPDRFRLRTKTAREEEQTVASDFDLVEAFQALSNIGGETATVHGRAVAASRVHDGTDRSFHAQLAMRLADLIVMDREMAFVA